MKNWRTTIIGALVAALTAAQPLIDVASGNLNSVNWVQLSMAVLFALLGYLSKDAGVSGTQK